MSNYTGKRGVKSTAALARATLGADTACARSDHFVASAMRTNNIHEHVPESFLDAIGVAVAVSNLWFAIVRRVTRDYIENFFLPGASKVRDRTIERLLFHLGNFLQWQICLSAAWRSRFLVTFDELAGQPPEYVVGNAGRVADVGILRESARLETLIRKFFH